LTQVIDKYIVLITFEAVSFICAIQTPPRATFASIQWRIVEKLCSTTQTVGFDIISNLASIATTGWVAKHTVFSATQTSIVLYIVILFAACTDNRRIARGAWLRTSHTGIVVEIIAT